MRRFAPFLILLAAVLLVYSPALRNGFVWDDTALVLRDPLIRSPRLLAEGFGHFLFLDATAADFYRPLQRVAYTCDYALAGFTPWVFHLTSILIHAGAAMALYAFGRRLLAYRVRKENLELRNSGKKRDQEIRKSGKESHDSENSRGGDDGGVLAVPAIPYPEIEDEAMQAAGSVKKSLSSCLRAFVPSCENKNVPFDSASLLVLGVALLWAVHPIHSSAVVYVAGVADPLAALLGFGGLALLLSRRWFAAGLCLGAALFAKESGVFGIVLGFGFAWAMARNESATWRKRLAQFARVAVPALVMVSLYLGLRMTAEHLPAPHPESVPFLTRPVLGLRAIAEYGGLLAAPVQLRMERDVRAVTGVAGYLQTLAGVWLVCGAAFWFWRSCWTTRTCLLAAFASYLPVSNLFSLNATVAEHWVYVPSAFLCLAAAATWQRCALQVRTRMLILCLAGIWLAALGCRTALRCPDWRDRSSFFHANIEAGGDSSRIRSNLASLKLSQGDVEGAVRDYREALKSRPNQPFAMLGLSGALIKQRQFAEAREWLERCEKSPLVRADALVQLAVLEFAESGRDRVDLLREAAEVNPRFWPVQKRYIGHLIERDEVGTALLELRAVLADQPFRAETWEMLGFIGEKMNNTELAQSAYAEADKRDIWRRRKY